MLAFVLVGRLNIFSWKRTNRVPCRGFVKKSAIISCVGQKATLTCSFYIWSVIK